eukprot:12912729-Heterocapsa_arctica.AAC.1
MIYKFGPRNPIISIFPGARARSSPPFGRPAPHLSSVRPAPSEHAVVLTGLWGCVRCLPAGRAHRPPLLPLPPPRPG